MCKDVWGFAFKIGIKSLFYSWKIEFALLLGIITFKLNFLCSLISKKVCNFCTENRKNVSFVKLFCFPQVSFKMQLVKRREYFTHFPISWCYFRIILLFQNKTRKSGTVPSSSSSFRLTHLFTFLESHEKRTNVGCSNCYLLKFLSSKWFNNEYLKP